MGDERATQALIAATRRPNFRVVEEAARALGDIGDRAAGERLKELMSYAYALSRTLNSALNFIPQTIPSCIRSEFKRSPERRSPK